MLETLISILACITGCLCIYIFMIIRRGHAAPYGRLPIIGFALLSLCLWTFSLGFERAIAIWAVQLMSTGVILVTYFAYSDAKSPKVLK